MRLLLDQNLSYKLVPLLAPHFPETAHVSRHDLATADDDTIWAFARDRGYAIVTKDDDYQLKSFARGHPPKVILLRSGNGPNSEVLQTLLLARGVIEHFTDDPNGSLLVLP